MASKGDWAGGVVGKEGIKMVGAVRFELTTF